MTTKIISLAGIAMLFFSCSDDDQPTTSPVSNNENAVFDHYTIESNTTHQDSETYRSFLTANLVDDKYFSETSEEFINGVGQGQTTTQHYFYDNGLLVKRQYDNDVRIFAYDSNGRLVGIDWSLDAAVHSYYRFVYLAEGKVYFERVTLPYNDPQTTTINRIVLEFDANDNVVKAGRDTDLDGTANGYHTFDYDAAGNLTALHESGGNTVAIAYAPIKDNFAKLSINTYGKKNLMVYQGECFANLLTDGLRQSPDLRMTDTQDALIETQALPYYFRKTVTQTFDDAVNTTVTTFYFQ